MSDNIIFLIHERDPHSGQTQSVAVRIIFAPQCWQWCVSFSVSAPLTVLDDRSSVAQRRTSSVSLYRDSVSLE